MTIYRYPKLTFFKGPAPHRAGFFSKSLRCKAKNGVKLMKKHNSDATHKGRLSQEDIPAMLDKIDLNKSLSKDVYKRVMPELSNRLYSVQKASWDAGIPVVILFEGWDAAGKGTSIQKLTSGLDPRGYKLYPIRAARTHEKKHPWLWRFWLKLPARGEWAIFDRSWYGRVMVEGVENLIPEAEWRRAYPSCAA